MTGPVVVTGSSGFVGRHLVAALAEAGYEVRAVARRHARGVVVSGVTNYSIADIVDADWSLVLPGAQTVVHLAAVAHQRGVQDRARVIAVNVTAVARLAAAARAAGVRRLVLLSSIGVLGSNSAGGAFTAHSVPNPHDFYSSTKLESERAAQMIADNHPLELAIVRSPLVFGPHAPGNFGRLLRLLDRRWPIPLGGIHNQRSLVSVWNLCDFLVACLASQGAIDEPLLVADDEIISTAELLRACSEILERPLRLLPVPVQILRMAAMLLGRRGDIDRLTQSLIVDTAASKARLGWQPPLTLRQGLTRTLLPEFDEGVTRTRT